MNLNAYDTIHPKVDKQKTWIDVRKHQLLSREIKYRNYVTISKRYDKENQTYDYFIILLDDYPQDRPYAKTKKDDYGRALQISCDIMKKNGAKFVMESYVPIIKKKICGGLLTMKDWGIKKVFYFLGIFKVWAK